MFIDLVKLTAIAGRGGDGLVSFRREKYVARGGPDGGNGGDGGHVLAVADHNQSSLAKFRYQPIIKASPGEPGGPRSRQGARGQDVTIKVPPGTVITDTSSQQVVADLTEVGQPAVIAQGGLGGFGNAHFKSSVRRRPLIAENGSRGQERQLKAELKLIADVGLVGLPNAGKSTFLQATTNAQPLIADYPFTTLSPNLGVVDLPAGSLLLADIPGLIEGASQGKGLGHQFLRHLERTKAILHLIDVNQVDINKAYSQIRQELTNYSQQLANLSEVVAITKIETVSPDRLATVLSGLKIKSPVLAISSHAQKNLKETLKTLWQKTRTSPSSPAAPPPKPVFKLNLRQEATKFTVKKHHQHFVVTGEKIENFAAKTRFEDYHSRGRLRHIMGKLGIFHELQRQGYQSELIIVGQPEIGRLSLVEEEP